MSTLTAKRRYTIHVPQLVGRVSYPQATEVPAAAMRRLVGEYDTAMSELQRFLKYLQDSADDFVAAGAFYTLDPEDADASAADPGDPSVGWSPGDHRHHIPTGTAVGLGNANAEGTGDSLARSDHVHKRDVRVRLNGIAVGTRNALNFSSSFVVTDDPGNDEVDVTLSPTGLDEAFAFAFLGY